MADDENVPLDTPTEPVEDTVETPEDIVEVSEETVETEPEIDTIQLQATNKKLFERAKKAEAEVKALKAKPAQAPTSPPVDVDERILKANGMPDALIKELRKVAKVLDVSLIDAQTDTIFVAVKEKFEKEQKQKKASVGASRGSGNVAPKKDFSTPGLTRDEHQKLAQAV